MDQIWIRTQISQKKTQSKMLELLTRSGDEYAFPESLRSYRNIERDCVILPDRR